LTNFYIILLIELRLLRKAQPGKAWAGPLSTMPGRGRSGQVHIAGAEGLAIQSSTIIGTPIYKAGLDAGDVILKADGKDITNAQAFNDIVAGKNIGDKIVVNYKNRTGDHETTITLEENPDLEVITFEKAGKELTKDQQDFRNNWLSTKVR
jgi:S1-C subfamily serine protease